MDDFGETGAIDRCLPNCKRMGSRSSDDAVEIAKPVVERRLGVAGVALRNHPRPAGRGVELML
jgi:hypothetical protein